MEEFRRLTIADVLLITRAAIQNLQKVHEEHIVHRDIKPENMMFAMNKQSLYFIDFGLAKPYITRRGHIENNQGNTFVGNAMFASYNVLNGSTYSRRDDLIGLTFCFIYLILGTLPWTPNISLNSEQKLQYIRTFKSTLNNNLLCTDVPILYYKMLEYSCSLNFSDAIDYSYLNKIIKSEFINLPLTQSQSYSWINSNLST